MYDIRNEIDAANIVVFTMYTEKDCELLAHLKNLGIKCVFDHCEAIFDNAKNKFMEIVDAITCCSTKLTEMTSEKGFKNSVTIKDPIDYTWKK